jgi:hypothetical protein
MKALRRLTQGRLRCNRQPLMFKCKNDGSDFEYYYKNDFARYPNINIGGHKNASVSQNT